MADSGTVSNTLPFKWVFIAIVLLLVIFFVANCWLSSIALPTAGQIDLSHHCSDGWKMCLGAILGLLGGRATDVHPKR